MLYFIAVLIVTVARFEVVARMLQQHCIQLALNSCYRYCYIFIFKVQLNKKDTFATLTTKRDDELKHVKDDDENYFLLFIFYLFLCSYYYPVVTVT